MTNDDQQLSQMTIMLMRGRRTQMIKLRRKVTMMIRRGTRRTMMKLMASDNDVLASLSAPNDE